MEGAVKELLEKQGHRIVGEHSAVKVCHWTKERLVRNRSCYKAKFYGIESHRCLQMTPSVAWCQHRCIFCWRPIEHTLGNEFDFEADEPDFIVEESIKQQKNLLGGYIGNEKADETEVKEAWEPKHAAISLAGEPTTYPYVDELINEFHKKGLTTFLVTNGQNPDALENITPTQLYLSLIAHDEELYKRMNAPQLRDGWERLNRSLEIFSQQKSRKVVRITLVRGFNLESPEKFAKLIDRANPDFIEPKGYVHVGYSRRRLERSDMPSLEEVLEFSKILGGETGYSIKDYSKDSKVALLSK
jgi:tRNA wybutosine-synthesizing protein 1